MKVLPLTRHVKSTFDWCYVDINTASDFLSRDSDKNSKNNKDAFCSLSSYCTKQVLCNKHFFLKQSIIFLYLIILLLAHKLCAGSPPQKFQLLFHLEVSPSKSKSKRNENISSCNKKLLKFEEYGRASVAFWQIRKHEIALFCSGQTEPYATTLALATL